MLKKISEERHWNLSVASAGMAAFPGLAASPEAIETAREKEFDLSGHQSQPLSKQLVMESDLILTMTRRHKEMILKKMPDLGPKVKMLSETAGEGEKDIEDPVGHPVEVYRQTLHQIEVFLEKSAGVFNPA